VGVAAWLQDLGLARYEAVFRESDIDVDVLPDLTEADLEKLGISLGHRKKLLRAIAEFRAPSDPAAASVSPISGADGVAQRIGPTEAERRQLTVLFCDLVGSTALSARLDPEDMGRVIRAYQECCADVVKRWGGHVAKYMGDGVLAYFGWPVAHEDEAERAVRAGLELTGGIPKLDTSAACTLAARIGIATGLVMVGELIGEGAARERTVVGETPNLAARLQALAAPSTVVISQATRRLLGGLFELEELGPKRLKGFAEPLAAWRVAGEGRAEGRFEARQTTGLTPLVGRDEEIALLVRRWQQVKDGEGQVVLLSGEPGIGKSRLVREMRARLEGEPHIRLLYQCSPHHTTSSLHPLIEQLERAAGFTRDDPPEARLDKLAALLARGTDCLDQVVPLIAALLGLPTDGRYPALDLTPQRQKQLTLAALVDQLDGLAADRPVLLAYEDVHWSDPSTQELLGRTIERAQRLPVLLLITFRPEFSPPWPAQPHVSTLALSRLGRREGAALVERVVRTKALPAEVAAQIVAKTDGVPLFVEELTKTVLESGLLTDAGDHYELSGPLPPLALPSTLHDSLLARLDRLAPVKEIAQIGAALGREFSHSLLAAVANRPEADLGAALDQLVAAELVYRRGIPPEATYTFKHALVQDAAYQSLLKSRRETLHARIATALEDSFPEIVAATPELIANHWTEAGRGEPAVRYWLQAGRRAAQRSADSEAVAHLRKGLETLSLLPEGADCDTAELDLQIAMGTRLMALAGWTAPEVVGAWTRARELCDRTGNAERLATVLWGQWVVQHLSADLERGIETAAHALDWAKGRGHLREIVIAHRSLGHALTHVARFGEAQWHLEQTAVIGAKAGAETFAGHAYDPVITSRTCLARCLLHCGHPDQASQLLDRALAEAEHSAHLPTIAYVLLQAIRFGYEGRQPQITQSALKRLVPLAREQGYFQWLAMAVALEGWIKVIEGEHEDGCAKIREGTEAWANLGNLLMRPFLLSLLADAHVRAGGAEEALQAVEDGLALVAAKGEVLWEPELHRLRGDASLLQPTRRSEADACYTRAIEVARGQGARLIELRAATGLARLWADQRKRHQARDLLAPVYGWFTEGFDTFDLQKAKALLDELR
jgi:class 3 adenylate cyclase/predicted ATPase